MIRRMVFPLRLLITLLVFAAGVCTLAAQQTVNPQNPLFMNHQLGTFQQDSTPPLEPFIYVFRSDGLAFDHSALNAMTAPLPQWDPPNIYFPIDANVVPLLNASCTPRKVKKAELLLRLDLGETFEWKTDAATDNVTVNFTFKVEAFDSQNNVMATFNAGIQNPITLSLNKNEPQKTVSIDYTTIHKNSVIPVLSAPAFVYRFGISKVTYSVVNGNSDAIKKKIRFWVGDRLEIVTKARPDEPTNNDPLVTVQQVGPETWANPVTFRWTPTCAFPNYQFQLLRLYNTLDEWGPRFNEKRVVAQVDWSKALTIETESSEPELTLTLTEGTGYYVWRVRPIGDFWEGGIANDDNWGVWSNQITWDTLSSTGISLFDPVTTSGQVQEYDCIFFYHQFDDNKNWIHQRSFSEGGHINEQMVYANGLNQVKQTQVRIPSKDVVLANQTVYDFAGRPSLTSLSAPVKNGSSSYQSKLSYRERLLQAGGVLYNSKAFDMYPYSAAPIVAGDVSDYYSESNPDQTIPSAEAYPFSRTLYYGDGTNRVREIGGPGYTHTLKIAANPYDIHTTRYTYSTPSDDELIAIFGHEAPAAVSVQKVTTRDANNTASVQYISKEGKVLATCLVDNGLPTTITEPDPDNNNNLVGLPAYLSGELAGDKEAIFGKRVSDTIRVGAQVGQYGHITSKNFGIEGSEQTVTLKYTVEPDTLHVGCGELEWCILGDYEVDVRLRDVANPLNTISVPLPVGKEHHIDVEGGMPPCSTVSVPRATETYNTSVQLSAGTYIAERHLKVNTMHTVLNGAGEPVQETYLDTYTNKIRTDLKTTLDAKLTPIYMLLSEDITDNNQLKANIEQVYEQYSTIEAGCCALSLPPRHDCDKQLCEGLKRTDDGKLDFETVLFKRWAGKPCRWGGTYPGNPEDIDNSIIPMNTYFITTKENQRTIENRGDFNTLIDNMIKDGYSCTELMGCWMGLVEGLDAMMAREGSNPEEHIKNDAFDLLDAFIRCTGTIYGRDDNPLDGTDPGLPESYSKVVLQAHKYFYYKATEERSQACVASLGVPPTDNPSNWYSADPQQYKWEHFYFCVTKRRYPNGLDLLSQTEIVTKCSTQCDSRLPSFVDKVIQAYKAAGKVVEGTPEAITQAPDINVEEIYCIAQRLVRKCKEDCASSNNDDVMKALTYDVAVHLPMDPNAACSTDFVKLDGPASYADNSLENFVQALNNALILHKNNPAFDITSYEEDWTPYYSEIAAEHNMGMECCGFFELKVRSFEQEESDVLWTHKQTFELRPPQGGGDLYFVRERVRDGIPGSVEILEEVKVCDLGVQCAPICFAWVEPKMPNPDDNPNIKPITFRFRTCEREVAEHILQELSQQRTACVEGMVDEFQHRYRQKFSPSKAKELFTVEYDIKQYHYTLYYYDRAGNLVKTVPPRGVHILADNPSPERSTATPAHTFTTAYKHNSLAQVVEQNTPDGGTTTLIYDSKGRVRFSQSARQKGAGKMSYTKYDVLGRVVEVGESNEVSLISDPGAAQINADVMTPTGDQPPFANTKFVTRTTYTETQNIYYNYNTKLQRYTRNRVTKTVTDEDGDFNTLSDQLSTFYSYDPHGNVEWIMQYLPLLGMKHVRYEYDLISNKPTTIHYNEGMVDQFHHRYSYDDENRLVLVETSRDGKIWDRDAAYKDYLHGAMKRVEIGEDSVQALDYVYTIHGWLKGINHPNFGAANTRTNDPGLDGEQTSSNKNVARDAFGMVLEYYKGDFTRNSSPFRATDDNSNRFQVANLFNGNIAGWSVNQEYNDQGTRGYKWTGETYRYDHLNRLLQSLYKENTNNTWVDANSYNNSYTYDPNGNILTLKREGPTATMDDLAYWYDASTNRLDHVDDVQGSGLYTEDIDDQNPDNYQYDADGNLTHDEQEGIDVTWNAYGKVQKVVKKNTGGVVIKTMRYYYDAQGNRVIKEVYAGDENAAKEVTWYVRAADGNVLAVYKKAGPVLLPAGGSNSNTSVLTGDAPTAMARQQEVVSAAQESTTHEMPTPLLSAPAQQASGNHTIPNTASSSVGSGSSLATTTLGTADNSSVPAVHEEPQAVSSGGSIELAELHIYGRSRLGILKPAGVRMNETENRLNHNVDVADVEHDSTYVRRVSHRNYELVDHLGNIRVVITDVKETENQDADGLPEGPYNATLVATNNYYPFGMLKPGQHWSSEDYRYGFNGKEQDNEWSGSGNSYDYGFRIYNPRIARFLSVDPLAPDYPEWSPYPFAMNRVIDGVDLDGLEFTHYSQVGIGYSTPSMHPKQFVPLPTCENCFSFPYAAFITPDNFAPVLRNISLGYNGNVAGDFKGGDAQDPTLKQEYYYNTERAYQEKVKRKGYVGDKTHWESLSLEKETPSRNGNISLRGMDVIGLIHEQAKLYNDINILRASNDLVSDIQDAQRAIALVEQASLFDLSIMSDYYRNDPQGKVVLGNYLLDGRLPMLDGNNWTFTDVSYLVRLGDYIFENRNQLWDGINPQTGRKEVLSGREPVITGELSNEDKIRAIWKLMGYPVPDKK